MELRHLRYFVAIAEGGSLTVIAARKLHTSQLSLSRQIRDLEEEVGAQLLTRRGRGIELTPAGRAFLEHARLALSQAPDPVVSVNGAGLIEAFAWETEPGHELHLLNYANPNMMRGAIRDSYPLGPQQVSFRINEGCSVKTARIAHGNHSEISTTTRDHHFRAAWHCGLRGRSASVNPQGRFSRAMPLRPPAD